MIIAWGRRIGTIGEEGNENGGKSEIKATIGAGGRMPNRSYRGDAGYDLFVAEATMVMDGRFTDIHCKVAFEFPDGVWGLIVGRSSTLRKRGLFVAPGIIDQGYRGELFTGVWNLSGEDQLVGEGERLAQIIPLPVMADGLKIQEVEHLSGHDRGLNGFGSTGE